MIKHTVPEKVLTLLKYNAKKSPVALSPKKLAEKWETTSDAVRCAFYVLTNKGCIKRVDSDGNTLTGKPVPLHVRVLQKAMEREDGLPYDRLAQAKLAKEFGVKTSSMHSCINRLRKHHIAFIYDKHLLIYKEDAAREMLDQYDTVDCKQRKSTAHYFMYVKDWPKKRKKPVAKKKPRKYLKHRIVEFLLSNGGSAWMGSTALGKKFNTAARSINRCCNSLKAKGIINKKSDYIEINDAEKARDLLAPFGDTQVEKHDTQKFPPIYIKVPPTTPEKRIRKETAVSTINSTAVADGDSAKFFLSWMLKVQAIERTIALMQARLPKNYEPGKEKIAMLYKTLSDVNDANSEEYRQQRGRMWGQACEVMGRIFTGTMQLFDISGFVNDETFRFAANEMRGMLATVEMPDNDVAETLADWVEGELPDDEECMGYIREFVEHSGSNFIGEFIARGGLQFICNVMHYAMCDVEPNRQAYAYQIYMYLAHIGLHEYNPLHPEYFRRPDFAAQQLAAEDSIYAKEAIAVAMYRYITAGNSLNCIERKAPVIVEQLLRRYPKNSTDGIYMTCAADELFDRLPVDEASDTLHEWIARYTPKNVERSSDTALQFTAQWYDAKIVNVGKYGLPGDVEILQQKSSALKRWHLLNEDGQSSLMGLLNKPTRYDDPRLDFASWRKRAELSKTMGGRSKPSDGTMASMMRELDE